MTTRPVFGLSSRDMITVSNRSLTFSIWSRLLEVINIERIIEYNNRRATAGDRPLGRDGVHATAGCRCKIRDAGSIACQTRREISPVPRRLQYFAQQIGGVERKLLAVGDDYDFLGCIPYQQPSR